MAIVFLSQLCSFASAQDTQVSIQTGSTAETVPAFLAPYVGPSTQKWQTDIAAFDERNATENLSQEHVLFVGSSSIRLWRSLAEDLPEFSPRERGFGGATFSDLAVFAPRILQPHHYRALVIFVANDITGGDKDKRPDEVETLVRYIVGVSRKHRPEAPILLIEITPTPSRFAVWPQIRQANAALREIALTEPGTYFLSTAEYFLTADNQPRPELFVEDRLHLNRAGYDLWTALVRKRLQEMLPCSRSVP